MNKKIWLLLSIGLPMYGANPRGFEGVKDPNFASNYKMGETLTNAAIDTAYSRVANSEASKEVVNAVSELISNTIAKSVGTSIKKSGQEAAEGLEEAGSEVGKGAAAGMDNFFSNIADDVGKGSGFSDLLKEGVGTINREAIWQLLHKNVIMLGGIGVGITTSVLIARYGVPMVMKMIERWLTRPKLIIESSKLSYAQFLNSWLYPQQPAQMVFSPELKQQLDDTIKVTSAIQAKIKSGKTNVKYRNLMLYGPPGTGKTMFAKELARRSGLEYAFMSGSSFSKFKDGEGIEALDELFAWAKRSKGLMIFIDEAETFLSKRENMDPQSKAYQLLNNFLNYTGERSNQFMLVFATNHQNTLDSAMYRRIDDLIEMPLPSKLQRIEALLLYRNKILMDISQNDKPFILAVEKVMNTLAIEAIADQTKGLSYGDIEGIMNALQTDSAILTPALITQDLVNKVVMRAVKKHETFTNGQYLGQVID